MARQEKTEPVRRPGRFLRWTLALLLLGGMAGSGAWGAMWLLEPTTLPLERVSIEGDIRHTRRAVLQRTLAGQLTGGFFRLDLEAMRAALEALPWVAQASVRRVWPGTLVVRVAERRALAHWGSDAVVSPAGEVFHPEAGSVPAQLPRLSGPAGSAPEVVERYGLLRERLRSKGLEIVELALSERHAWTLELADGLRLQLGNRDLEARVERFLGHYEVLQRQGRLELVDLRYANGFAVRLRQRPQDATAQNGTEG